MVPKHQVLRICAYNTTGASSSFSMCLELNANRVWTFQFLVCSEYTVFRELDVEASLNVMAHAQKPDFVFRRNGRVHLSRRGRQFSRLLAADVCASAVVMLDTPCSEVVWRVLAAHFIRQFPLHFPSRASPCAVTFQLESTTYRLQLIACRSE